MPKYQAQYWPHSEPTTPDEPEPAPSNGPCTHWCNHKWRKALEAHDKAVEKWIARGCTGHEPQPPEIEPWPGEPNICRKCATVVRSALRELPRAYDALASVKFLTRCASADDERRGRSDVPASPSPGADHQDEICSFARDWEDNLRRHLGHRAAEDEFGDSRATLAASVEYLNANYDAVLDWDYDITGEFAKDIHKAYATAVAMCKNKPVRRHLPTPCPSPGCGLKALIQEEGVAGKVWYVECSERLGGCGRLYAESDWEWFGRLLVDGHVQMPMVPVEA
jgi:hypothetical protein